MPFIDVGGITGSLTLNIRPFQNALAQAMAGSKHWAQATAKIMAGATSSPAQMMRAQAQAAATAQRSATAAATANVKATAQASAQAATAQARAAATVIRANAVAPAQAQATVMRAQATGQAQAIRAQGSAAAMQVRAAGGAAAQMVAAQGVRSAARLRALANVAGMPGRFAGGLMTAATGRFVPSGAFGAGLAVGTGLAATAREAMNLETEMVRLSRVTGLEGRALADMGEQFKEIIANASGASLEDVFGIAQMGARMGLASGSLRLFTADMVKLRTVMDEQDIPIGEAVTGISRLMQIYGRGAHETLNFASTLLKLDQASTATARDILNISTRLAGPAAMFGLTPQKLMALAAALRDAGVPLETAATATGQILQRMASRKDMPDFARIAGMNTRGFGGLLRADPLEALKAVAKGLQGMDAIQGSRALENLSLDGQRVRMVMLGLAQVLDKLNGLVKTANEEFASGALIQTFFGKQAGTAAATLMRLWNNVRLAAAAIGQGLLPVIKGFSEGSISLLDDVRKWFDRNAKMFESWGASLGDTFSQVKLLFRNFQDMAEKVGLRLAFVFQNLGDAIIAAFDGAIDLVSDNWEVFAKKIGMSLRNMIKDVAAPFVKGFEDITGLSVQKQLGMNFREKDQDPRKFKDRLNLMGLLKPAMAIRDILGLKPAQAKALEEVNGRLIEAGKKLAKEREKEARTTAFNEWLDRKAAQAKQIIQNLKDAAKRPAKLTAKQLQAQQRAREMAAARQALGIGARGGPMRATAKARAAQKAAKAAREAARKAGRRNRPPPFGFGQPRPPAAPFERAGPPHLPNMPAEARDRMAAAKDRAAADAKADQALRENTLAAKEVADAMKTITRIMAGGGILPGF